MISKIKTFFELIKFEHTVFALPFAYLGMMMAHNTHVVGNGRDRSLQYVFVWVTLAMVGARTAAMTLNRIIDLKIDRINPRTENRPICTGQFSVLAAWSAVAVSLALFFISAALLNPLCFKLSFAALGLLAGYHYVKRFSFLCHFALGLVLAAGPMGGWLAVTGRFSWRPVPLALAVLFWVAGFDILYSLQDMDFDKAHGLHSIPVRYGQNRALRISEYCHWATAGFLILFGVVNGLGIIYWAGVALCAAVLKLEHGLISEDDLSRINTAFFTLNGWVGVLLLAFTFLETFR